MTPPAAFTAAAAILAACGTHGSDTVVDDMRVISPNLIGVPVSPAAVAAVVWLGPAVAAAVLFEELLLHAATSIEMPKNGATHRMRFCIGWPPCQNSAAWRPPLGPERYSVLPAPSNAWDGRAVLEGRSRPGRPAPIARDTDNEHDEKVLAGILEGVTLAVDVLDEYAIAGLELLAVTSARGDCERASQQHQ
jgi:hypothetical protein